MESWYRELSRVTYEGDPLTGDAEVLIFVQQKMRDEMHRYPITTRQIQMLLEQMPEFFSEDWEGTEMSPSQETVRADVQADGPHGSLVTMPMETIVRVMDLAKEFRELCSQKHLAAVSVVAE